MMSLEAAECRATFVDGLSNSSNGGKVKFEDSAQLLNNPDTVLATTEIDNDGDVPSCGSAYCSLDGTIVPQVNGTFISHTSNSNLTVNGNTQNISANDYKNVTVKSGGSLFMSTAFSSYHFKKLKVESNSFIPFSISKCPLSEI
jgi:hypothetical protein